jgi:hypothetical protein
MGKVGFNYLIIVCARAEERSPKTFPGVGMTFPWIFEDPRREEDLPYDSILKRYLWVTTEHFEEWWGYGAFFLVAALAQALYAPLVVVWPTRIVLLLGIGGNLTIVVLYLLTRTVGIPLFGPGAGEVEGVSFIDLCATTSEVGIAVALGGRC